MSSDGLRQRPERGEGLRARLGVAGMDQGEHQRRRADRLRRHDGQRRQGHREGDDRQLLGRLRAEVDEPADGLLRQRQDERPAVDHADIVEPVAEPGDDAEVAAAAADGPEEVLVLIGARVDDPAVGRDELHREQAVDRQAVLAHEVADAAAERQAGDTHRRRVAERGREAELGRRLRVLARRQAGTGPRDLGRGIDVEALELGGVDDHAVVDHRVAGDAVPAAADRDLEAAGPGEPDRPRHVLRVGDPDDGRGTAIDGRIVELARVVVRGVARQDDVSAEGRAEGGEVGRGGRQQGFHGRRLLGSCDGEWWGARSAGAASEPMLAARPGRVSRRAPPRPADVRAQPGWTSVHGSSPRPGRVSISGPGRFVEGMTAAEGR